ncbi:MAG: hypothetical protein QM765_39125 [Myxococcales bacterium]
MKLASLGARCADWELHDTGARVAAESAAVLARSIEAQEKEATEAATAFELVRQNHEQVHLRVKELEQERGPLGKAAQEPVLEPIDALRFAMAAARGALADANAVRGVLEDQLERAKEAEKSQGALAERVLKKVSTSVRKAVEQRTRQKPLPEDWVVREERDAAAAQKDEREQEDREAGEHQAAQSASVRAAEASLFALERETSLAAGDPGDDAVEALAARVEECRRRVGEADKAMRLALDREQEARVLVDHIRALLQANQIQEGESSELPVPDLEALGRDLGQVRGKAVAAEAARKQRWSTEENAYRGVFEHLEEAPPSVRARLGNLPELREKHDAKQWDTAREALARAFDGLRSLREAAALEKERLDTDRQGLVDDLVRAGEELASRLKRIAPLSKVNVAGGLSVPMLAIQLQRSSEERSRELAGALFARYLEAVRSGRMRPDVAQLELLKSAELLRCVVDGEVEVRFLKPQADLAASKPIRWEEATRWSGGESFVTGLVLLMALLAYRAREASRSVESSQVILLDNPVGKVNAPHLLRIAFELAHANRFQLIALTGIREPAVVGQFQRAVSVCKVPQRGRFLVTVDKDDPLPHHAASFAATDYDLADLAKQSEA